MFFSLNFLLSNIRCIDNEVYITVFKEQDIKRISNTLHPLLDQSQCIFGCKHDSCVILGVIMALLLSYLEIKHGFKRYIWVPS